MDRVGCWEALQVHQQIRRSPARCSAPSFLSVHDRRYTVYWDIFTEPEWLAREAERKAELERLRQLEARTIDQIAIGEMQSNGTTTCRVKTPPPVMLFGRKWRHATDGGWFAFDLKTAADLPNQLSVTYWGSDGGGMREFDILVDGTKVARQTLENNRPTDSAKRFTCCRGSHARQRQSHGSLSGAPAAMGRRYLGARMLRQP